MWHWVGDDSVVVVRVRSPVILQIKVPNSCDVVRETEYGPKLLRRRPRK